MAIYIGHDWWNDTIDASDFGNNNDLIDGKAGNDRLYGNLGADTVFGGLGRDSIWGGSGKDSIYGGSGSDYIDGGSQNDRLYGNSGNDRIVGGSGNDSIFGGTGIDTIIERGDSDFELTNSSLISDFGTDYLNSIEQATLTGGRGANFIQALSFSGQVRLDGGSGDDTVYGGTANDTILGRSGDDYLYGYAGNDILVGDAGNDSLFGGNGHDTLYGGDTERFWSGDDYTSYNSVTEMTGNAGRDLFVVGTGLIEYSEANDYILIQDFQNNSDRIQLFGRASDYRLGSISVDGYTGMGIYSSYRSVDDELVAIVRNANNSLSLNNLSQFVYS